MKSRIIRAYKFLKIPIGIAVSFAGGFVFSFPFLSGNYSPFAVSFSAALNGFFSASAAIGSAVGFFVFHSGASSFRYFAVLVVSTSALRLSLDVFRLKRDKLLKLLCPAVSTLIINAIYLFSQKFSPGLAAVTAVESVLTATAVPVFEKGINQLIHKPLRVNHGEEKDIICRTLLVALAAAHFMYFDKIGTAAVIFIDFLMILFFSYSGEFYSGVAAGVCCGFAFALNGGGDFLSVMMIMCGCVCDFFEPGRFKGAALSFLCAAAGIALNSEDNLWYLLPAGAASAIFCIIPEKYLYFKEEKLTQQVDVNSFALSKNAKQIASAVEGISECMSAVRTSLEPFTKLRLEDELRKTREKVCAECELKESCVNEIRQADDMFYKRIAEDVRCGRLGIKSFSDKFESTCCCSDKIIREFNKANFVYRTNVTAQNKMNRVQSLAGSQFKTFGGVIGSACATLERLSTAEKSPSAALMLSAKEFGLDVKRADICLDKAGRDYFEITFLKSKENFRVNDLLNKICADTGYRLDFPTLIQKGNEYTLVFRQSERLKFKIAAASAPSTAKGVCGDYYRCFKDDSGRQIVLLSDGMGTGGRAAVDSAFTCETVSALLKAGIDEKTAVAALNSAMIMKSTDESLSTVDLLRLDPVEETAEFFKCGAAPSFISKGRNQSVLEPESTPVGILDNVNMAAGKISIEPGDIILLVSDGVSGERYRWICSELSARQAESAGELARHILTCAKDRMLGKRPDDMTVIAVMVTE